MRAVRAVRCHYSARASSTLPSTRPPASTSSSPSADRWAELRRLLSSAPTHSEDFGRRVRKLVKPGEETSAVWAMKTPDAQAAVLGAVGPTSGQLAQFLGALLYAHPSGAARPAVRDLAPLIRHVGSAYAHEDIRRALGPIASQIERVAPQVLQRVPEGSEEWASGEMWGLLLGRSVPEALRDDYEGVAASLVELVKGPWARYAPASTGPSRSLFSLRHAVRLGTSAMAQFDKDWVNEEMFDVAKTLQDEIAQHFHKLHPTEAFETVHYAALGTDLVTLLAQKLKRDTWTDLGYVNSLLHHLATENIKGDAFIRYVHDVKHNLRGTLTQRVRAYATDLLAPVTGHPFIRPPVKLRSIC